jgi:putative transposase
MPDHAELVICEQSIERTIAWIDHNRRMSKDYERLPESAEAFIYVAMSRQMLRRLARS